MSANTNPIFPATMRSRVSNIYGDDQDWGNKINIFNAGVNGTRIDAIVGASDSGVPVAYRLIYESAEVSGGDQIPIGYGEIPAGAGYTAPLHNMMPDQLLDADGKFYMAAGDGRNINAYLYVEFSTALPADKGVMLLVQAGDY